MSDLNRSMEVYLERYAEMYCSGNVEEAKKHAIVREVMEEKKNDAGI